MSATGYILSVLTGGLAGSVLTLLSQSFLRWWRRPILEIVFQSGEPGCDVKTHGFRVDERGKPILDGGKPIEVQQRCLRLKLKNGGKTFAENCSVNITEIGFKAPGQGSKVFEEEVLELRLALTGSTSFNLASGGHRFLDIAHTEDSLQGHSFGFDAAQIPVRLGRQGFGVGTFTMKVFAAANNAASVSREVKWSYDGQAGGVRIV